MTNAIVPYRPLTPSVWQMIKEVAPTVWRAGIFGVGSEQAAASIMLKGYELGLGLAASFEFIHVVQGRPTLSPKGMLALIQNSGELAEMEIRDLTDGKKPTRCRVRMKRQNGFEHTIEYSMNDAERAGLVKPLSGWDKYPANMLRWRAIGFCADVVFPDVIGGMKRADEFGAAITEDGDVVEGDWTASPKQEAESEPIIASASVEYLLAEYGPEAIMAANNGKIPANDEELAAVATALAEAE